MLCGGPCADRSQALIGDLVADRNALAPAPFDGRPEPGVFSHVIEELPDSRVVLPEHVVGGEAPVEAHFRLQILEIPEIPVFVRVAEDEINWTFQGRYLRRGRRRGARQ